MFIGRYEHQLEAKGRLSIPKKFRSQLEGGAIISQGLDGCLAIYPKPAWEQLVSKLAQLPLTKTDARAFSRHLSFGAFEVEIDSLGRVLIPDLLRSFASLKDDCVVTGGLDRIEIWDKSRFTDYISQITSHAEEIAEKLDLS